MNESEKIDIELTDNEKWTLIESWLSQNLTPESFSVFKEEGSVQDAILNESVIDLLKRYIEEEENIYVEDDYIDEMDVEDLLGDRHLNIMYHPFEIEFPLTYGDKTPSKIVDEIEDICKIVLDDNVFATSVDIKNAIQEQYPRIITITHKGDKASMSTTYYP